MKTTSAFLAILLVVSLLAGCKPKDVESFTFPDRVEVQSTAYYPWEGLTLQAFDYGNGLRTLIWQGWGAKDEGSIRMTDLQMTFKLMGGQKIAIPDKEVADNNVFVVQVNALDKTGRVLESATTFTFVKEQRGNLSYWVKKQ